MPKVLFWIVAVPLAAAVIVFSVNNRADVVLDLWPLDLVTRPLPVYVVVVAGLFLGFVGGSIATWIGGSRTRRRARAAERRAESTERELAATQQRIERLEKAAKDSVADPGKDRPRLPHDAA